MPDAGVTDEIDGDAAALYVYENEPENVAPFETTPTVADDALDP